MSSFNSDSVENQGFRIRRPLSGFNMPLVLEGCSSSDHHGLVAPQVGRQKWLEYAQITMSRHLAAKSMDQLGFPGRFGSWASPTCYGEVGSGARPPGTFQ